MHPYLERWLPPVARIFLSAIFLGSAYNKITDWSGSASYMEQAGMVFVSFFLAAAIVVEILGGLSVLLGLKPRWGAVLLFLFLIPTTLIFHDFWTHEGAARQNQMIHFMKNIAIMGGLIMVMGCGGGTLSTDSRTPRHSS